MLLWESALPTMIRKTLPLYLLMVGSLFASAGPAAATIIWDTGNVQATNVNIQGGTDCASATSCIGDIGNTGFSMTFNSMLGPNNTTSQGLPILMHGQHGVSYVESQYDSTVSTSNHTGFSSLTLTAINGAWTSGDIALDLLGTVDTTVTFEAFYNNALLDVGSTTGCSANTVSKTYSCPFDATGQNQFNFVTSGGELVNSIAFFTSPDPTGTVDAFNIADVKQVSLNPVGVPEPSSMLLLGSGLLGLGLFSRRARNRS